MTPVGGFHDSLTKHLDVSRETTELLAEFVELVRKWNPKINLVAKDSLADIWDRHIADSAQIMQYVPQGTKDWTDIGSGGGFPAIVCAIMAKQMNPGIHITCVESDQRKSAFLTVASRTLGLKTTILPKRAETVAPNSADILTARALASLDILMEHTRILRPKGIAIFPKGANHRAEIQEALARWRFSVQTHPSKTHPEAAVLCIREIERV